MNISEVDDVGSSSGYIHNRNQGGVVGGGNDDNVGLVRGNAAGEVDEAKARSMKVRCCSCVVIVSAVAVVELYDIMMQ